MGIKWEKLVNIFLLVLMFFAAVPDMAYTTASSDTILQNKSQLTQKQVSERQITKKNTKQTPNVKATGDLSLDLKWLNAPSGQEQNMSWSDSTNFSNAIQSVKYSLDIHTTNTSYDTGKLVIRIKRTLWKDRNGNSILPSSIGIPEAPGTSEDVPFNYTVDTNTDEFVITNTSPTEAASNYSIQMQYNIRPWDTIDDSKSTFIASGAGTDSTGNVNSAQSPAITYTVDTGFKTNNVVKEDPKPMYYWDSRYTNGQPKPADFDQYRWVTWRIGMSGAANQPYNVTLKETPGQGGQVYLISNGDVYYQSLSASDYTIQPDGTTITSKNYTNRTDVGPASSPNINYYLRVLVRYPKTSTTTLTNSITESLAGIDDKTPQITNASSSTQWKDYSFGYSGNDYQMIKYSGDWDTNWKAYPSKFTALKNGMDVNTSWGMVVTNDLYAGTNYTNGITYSGEMTDDFTHWELVNADNSAATSYITMTPDDYTYNSVTISSENYKIDRSNGNQVLYSKGDKSAPLIKIWALLPGSSDYQFVDQVYASDVYYDNGSGVGTSVPKSITLPSGTYKVKTTYDNAVDHFKYRVDMNLTIKSNSPQLKKWMEYSSTENKNLRIQNFNYYKLFNQDGSFRNSVKESDYKFGADQVDNATLAAADKAQYGQYVYRSTAGILLQNITGSSTGYKYASPAQNDPAKQVVNMEYWLHGEDRYEGLSTSDYQSMIAAGFPSPSRDDAVFYDLLPLGMFYNTQKTPTVYDILGNTNTSNVTVNTISDYKGTGRQLVIFKVTAKQAGKNYVQPDGNITVPSKDPNSGKVNMVTYGWQPFGLSGYTLRFDAQVSWDNISYAQNGVNLGAYQVPEDNPLRGGGFSDDGSASPMDSVKGNDGKPIFYDLRGNGVNEVKDTLYMSDSEPINVSVAAGSGLSKLVRSDADGELANFTTTTKTKVNTGYTYQLKLGTDANSKMQDAVLFDILEEAANTENHTGETSWKGIFDSIDLNYAIQSGIKPVVYYSTKSGMSYNGLNATSLTNGDWTTVEPTDKSTITAVAVDLRKTTNGNAFVFDKGTATKVLIHMIAPGKLSNAQFAYNRAAYYSTLISATGDTSTKTNVGSRVSVSLYDDPKFTKSSTPAGGDSESNATDVQANDIVSYHLAFNAGTTNVKDIVMSDAIPSGMTIVPGSITFTAAGTTTPVSISDTSYNAGTNVITWPSYTQNSSGNSYFDFKVTVDPLKSGTIGEDYRLYKNQGTVTVGNEPPIKSNVITHQQKNRWADITKTASLVEGVVAGESNAAFGGVVLPENSGTNNNPVFTKLGQIIEYHLVVKNTGKDQLSDKINVEDVIPSGTNYIKNSATAKFQGATNSQAISQIDDTTSKIKWTLDKMSDGETANLTFRVSAPTTAFNPNDTTSTSAEKTFTNIGQMIDVQKNEHKTTNTTYHNVQEARISVQKIWDDNNNQDGIRPTNIQIQLYANGQASGTPIRLDEANRWKYDWQGLPMKEEDGEMIHYTVKENTVIDGYKTPVYSNDLVKPYQVNITNKHVPTTTEKTVTKVWDDKNNKDGKRPTKILIQLSSNGTAYGNPVELSEANSWKYTWKNLPEKSFGKKVVYIANEVGDPGEYQEHYSGDTFTIINSYTPKQTSRTVMKSWKDDGDLKARPKEIKVQLYADGIAYGEPISLKKSSDWKYTWLNLPLIGKRGKIVYTVKEVGVMKGYVASYNDHTLMITNKALSSPHKSAISNLNKPISGILPKTGETIFKGMLLVIVITISLVILILKRTREDKHD